jgi:hypothetical protein
MGAALYGTNLVLAPYFEAGKARSFKPQHLSRLWAQA